MNPLERVKATLRFERTDRIPVIPEVAAVTARLRGKSVKEYVTSGEVLAECQLTAQETFQYDAVIAFADLCVEAEAIGCELVFPADNYPHVKRPAIQSINELSALSVPNPLKDGRMPELIKAVNILKEKSCGRVPVVAHALGPLTIASRIMDIEKMLYMIVDEPDNFKKLLAFTLEVTLVFIRHLLAAGADCIIMFNPSASPAVLPAKIFKEFELPNLKRIFSFVKEFNPEAITWYSVAGAVQDIIKELEHVNLDIMTIDYLVPLDVAFSLSSSLCFNGNIKPISFVNEKPEEIFSQSTALLQTSLERGRFILGSGCEVPPNARLDTVQALVNASIDAARNFTRYGNGAGATKCVSIFPFQKKVYVQEGIGVIEAAAQADVHILNLCNKAGVCGSCVVQVGKGVSGDYSKKESVVLTPEQKEKNYRFACRIKVTSDMEIYIPRESRIKNEYRVYQKDFVPESIGERYDLNPSISAIKIPLRKKPDDKRPDLEIIRTVIGSHAEFFHRELKRVPDMVRSDKEFFCILDTEKGRALDLSHSPEILGMAVDIGTTTIAIYLHDLETGKIIASGSILNPQFHFGDNIMTRAQRYLCGVTERTELRSSLIKGINTLLLKITQDKGLSYNHLYKMVVVGNSVMHHIFLDMDLQYLVKSPFTPVFSSAYTYINKDKGGGQKLTMNENGLVVCPPLLNGFVGSDTVAGILASGLYQSEEPVLLVDLGTNGEIVLGNKEKILVTSAAAGPAFERFSATAGKLAAAGAMYRVAIDEHFRVTYKTLENSKPSGLCGSAIVDAIASFVRLGIIDRRGRFVSNPRCNSLRDSGYILVPRQDTAAFQPIVITARDIEEVQKAKGGIMAGIAILMREYGITSEGLGKVVLTGGFGMNVNVDNAIRIGLIPEVPVEKVGFISNAAGVGARLYLLYKEAVRDVEAIIGKIRHINVANDAAFNNIFIDAMLF